MNYDPSTQASDEQCLAEAVKNASSLIANCPSDWLQDLFTKHCGSLPFPDYQGLKIHSHLIELECTAALGSTDAVRNMVEVGLRISKFLDSSTTLETPDGSSKYSHCPEDYRILTSAELKRRLEKCYKDMSAAPLQDLFKKDCGSPIVPDFQGHKIQSHLIELEGMAALGSEDAVRVMVEVALRISRFLNSSCSIEIPDGALDASSKSSTRPEDYAILTSTELKRRLEKCYRDISAASVTSLEQIEAAIGKKYGSDPYGPESALGMFSSALSGDLFGCRDPDADVQGEGESQNADIPGTRAQYYVEIDRKRNAIDWIFHRLLVHRTRKLTKQTVKNTASTRITWPVEVSADAEARSDDVEEKISRVGLADDVKINISSVKRGGKRGNNLETPLSVALQIYYELEGERRRGEKMSETQRQEYREAEIRLKSGEPDEPAGSLSGHCSPAAWTPKNHWQRKAALLPPLSKRAQEQWIDAAMSCLASRVAVAAYPDTYGHNKGEHYARLAELELKRYEYTHQKCGNLQSIVWECDCPACRSLMSDHCEKVQVWNRQEAQLLKKWDEATNFQFSKHAWPERRGEDCSRGKVREVIKNALIRLLKA